MNRTVLICGLVLACCGLLPAQSVDTSPDAQTGRQRYGSYFSSNPDTVNNFNGNVLLDIPLFTLPGREVSAGLHLVYNSQKWEDHGSGSSHYGVYLGGWHIVDPTGVLQFGDTLGACVDSQVGYWYASAVWIDGLGTKHSFYEETQGDCDENNPPDVDVSSSDGQHIRLLATSTVRELLFQDGTEIDFTPTLSLDDPHPAIYRTPNGNYLESGIAGGSVTDTLGRTITLDSSCSPASGVTYCRSYTITGADGNAQHYKLNYVNGHDVLDPYWTGGGHHDYLNEWLVSIDLPGSRHYTFDYNHEQGFLTKIILPSGAYIEYLYHTCTSSSSCTGTTAADDYLDQRIESADGTSGAEKTWTYTRTTSGSSRVVTLANPDTSSVEHTFDTSGLETETRWIGADSAVAQVVDNAWSTDSGSAQPINPRVDTTTTTLGSWKRRTTLSYDPYDTSHQRVIEKDESDWYTGSTPAPLAKTTYGYTTFYNTLTNRQVLGTVEVLGWNSTLSTPAYETQAKTEYLYDETTPTSTSSSVPHKGSVWEDRGNVTTIHHYWDATHYVSETFAYDDLGNMLSHHDPLNHETVIGYADNFHSSGDNGLTFAYPTSVTNAKSQTAYIEYDFQSGAVTKATDVRGQFTTSTYDLFSRPSVITAPSGQVTTYYYDDSAHTVTEDVLVASGKHRTSEVIADGLFRPLEVIQFDPNSSLDVHVVTHYDANGRVHEVSSPYRSGETVAYTTSTYDVLNRPKTITNPDGSSIGFEYSGNQVVQTDEAGMQRRQTVNGLGQLIEVEEPDPNPSYAPASLSHVLATNYSYDVTGALRQVVQQGSQTRTYTYNWLGQLKSEDHPETGETDYTYDDAGRLHTRYDARTITTTYEYDEINRLLTTEYSDSTPKVTNAYDASTYTGLLTSVVVGPSTPLSTTTYAYTAAGLVSSEARTFNGVTGTFTSSYTYDYAGRLLTATYPSGRVVTQTYVSSGDVAGDRIDAITDTTTLNTILGSVSANAAGQVTSRTLGSGTVVAQSYNNRNQLTNITASQSGTNLLSMNYSYTDVSTGGSTANVGRIRSRTDNLQPEHSVDYVYDSLYRLTEANGVNSTWSVQWALNSFGGRTGQTASGMADGLGNQTIGVSTSTNRMTDTGVTYDAAGNLTNDGTHSFSYDAEGRLSTGYSSAVQYEYDGAGRRLKTTTSAGTTYTIYGLTGLQSEFTTVSTGATSAASSDRLYYRVPEQTGTSVLMVSASGTPLENNRVFPYGEPWRTTNASTTAEKFTSYDRDATTGLDYAMARDYASHYGRFQSPDPGHVGASLGDPQSWNGYGYSRNDPINYVDPSGMKYTLCDTEECDFDYPDQSFNDNFISNPRISFGSSNPAQLGGGSIYQDHRKIIGTYTHTSLDSIASDDAPVVTLSDLNPLSDDPPLVFKGFVNAVFNGKPGAGSVQMAVGVIPGVIAGVSGAAKAAMSEVPAAASTAARGSTTVYYAVENGVVKYVGITDNLIARAAAHLREKDIVIKAIPGLTNLTRAEARSVEQVLIEVNGLMKNGGTLINRINSIAESNPIYGQSIKVGKDLLRHVGYPGF